MTLPFVFPPNTLHSWCLLTSTQRRLWLDAANRRCFGKSKDYRPSTEPGRTVVLDGAIIDNRLGFYCAMGEAVNGPGGYFGRSLMGFDDCLFGGFGLEFPYTFVWKNASTSRQRLGHEALLEYLKEECNSESESEEEAEAMLAFRKKAEAEKRTLFDEIVDAIQTIPKRGGGAVTLILD